MSHPLIAMGRNRAIRIDYPRLFRDSSSISYEEFLVRGFEVEEVVSVEVDRVAGSAVVHLHPRCKAALDVLSRLAERYEESRMPIHGSSHRPYFVLQEEGGHIIYARAPEVVSGVRLWFYRGLSTMFFGLSIIGVWTPLLPTTPFVILSSYYALRSSSELNERLLRSRLFGRILNDWHLHRAMRRSTKRRVLIFMVVVFALTFALMQPSASSLPLALLISLFSFGFVLQMPVVEDPPVLSNVAARHPATFQLATAISGQGWIKR